MLDQVNNTMSQDGLPPGWEKRIDHNTGKVFYIDHNTKSTMWDLPPHIKEVVKQNSLRMAASQQQPPTFPQKPPTFPQGPYPLQSNEDNDDDDDDDEEEKTKVGMGMGMGTGGSILNISVLPQPNQVSVMVPGPSVFAPSVAPVPIPQQQQQQQPSEFDPFFGDSLPQSSSQPPQQQQQQPYNQPYGEQFMKGNEYEEQHQKQSCFMPSMGPSIIDFNNAQPQPQQPQQSTNENSNEKYVNPQAIIVMERPLLCTSRPGWKGPCAGDTERCAGCGTKYGLLRRSQFCPCCMRAYCNSCMTHKAVVPGQRGRGGAERAAVCDACYSHLSREDMRCVPRLVPYISEKNPSIRLEALRELLELLQTTADNDIPRTEFLACSTISTLRGIFASTNSNSGGSGDGSGSGSGSGSGGNRSVDRSEVECAASILARLLAFGPSSSDRVLEEKGYVASIVDAAERDGERAPGLAAVIAGLAGTVPGRRALLETRRVYRALSKALAGGSPAVVPNCVHALRALASGKEDKPGRNPEAESEILILSSLSAILAGSQQQPAEVAVSLRSDALSAADKLCYTKETKMFLCQSDGVSNVLHALAQPLLPPSTAADIRHGASILYKFAAIDECAPTVAKAAGEIVTLAAAAQDDPETQGGLLQVVGKLARNPATKAPVAALTVARAADFAAVFASLNPIVETAGLRIILAALEADPAHAQAAFAATDIPATLRRIVAARSPEAQKAFKALALIDPSNLKDVGRLGMTATVIEGFGKGEWDAVSVVASITSDPVAARCVLESPAFLDALVPLLTSPEGRVIQAAWGIVANLSGIPGFGAAMLSKGAFNSIHSILAAGPAPLQTSAVEAMGKMCLADHILAGALLRESVVMKLAEFCNTADPALQLTALAVCADVFLCYPPFYPEFMKVGGLDAVLNAAASSATAPAARERAVFILTCAVSTSEANKNALANTVPVFTDTLFSATGPARTHAAAGLGFFAQWLSPADERAILDSGSVLALVAAAAAAGSNSAQQQQQQQSPETAAAALAESVVQRRTALDTLNKLLSRSPSCCAAALESSAITTAKDALKEGEDATLHAPALGVLSCLLQSAPAATQAEFCAGGGLELLTGLCSRDASVKDAAMGLLADLSAKNPQAAAQYSKLGSLGDVLPLLGAQDLRVRERALAVVAGLAAHDPAGVTQELAAKRCLPPVIATFVAAPLATPAKRDSLIIIAAAWQSGCSEALTQLASFQAAQYVVPVLASDDSATTVPALVVLSLAHLTEDRIVPGSLTTPIALTNLCRAAAAAATTTTTSSKKDDDGNSDDEDDDDDDGTKSESALDQLLDNGKKKKELNYGNEEKLLASKMALYILSVLLKKYPDAVRPHLCSENAVPSLFANLCTITTTTTTTNNNNNNDNSNINNSDTIDSFVGVILLALRRCPELRDRLLAMPGAHRGIDVLLAACEPLPPSSQLLLSSSPPSQPSPTARAAISAEVLFILAGAPGNVFAAIVERANYARAASALTAHLASPSPSMYTVRSLLVVICAVLRNECARPHIAAALSFEALSGLLTSSSSSSSPDNNRDVQDAHNLAVSATGVLASTNIFRAAQASRAGEWAGILTGLLAGAAEDAAVRTLSIAVGLAPCAAFRKAFCVCDALVEQAAEAARNVYAPRAQVLALRLLALLHVGVEQTQGVFEATVGQAQPNTAVVAEALRYYAGLLSPEALWEFFGVEGRVKALWDAHCVCTTPAPLLALLTLCTTLAENDGLREVLAKLISGDALAKLAASFPFATDYAAVLKTCIGI